MKDINEYRLAKLEDKMSGFEKVKEDLAYLKASVMIWNMIGFLVLGSLLTIAARTYIFTQ